MIKAIKIKRNLQGIVILLEVAIYVCFMVAVYQAITDSTLLANFATAYWNHLILYINNACTCLGLTCFSSP